MVEYLLDCPDCQTAVSVGTARAGGEVTCGNCGKDMAVPKLGELRLRPMAQSAAPSAAAPKEGRSSGGFFLAAATLAAIALLAAGFSTLRYLTIDVQGTTAGHIADIRETYPLASPAQLANEYERINEFGVELPRPYAYHATETKSNQWRLWAIVLGGIGLTSLAGAVVSGRRQG